MAPKWMGICEICLTGERVAKVILARAKQHLGTGGRSFERRWKEAVLSAILFSKQIPSQSWLRPAEPAIWAQHTEYSIVEL